MIAEGHTPRIEDSMIQDATRVMGMLNSGINVDLEDITAKQVSIMNLLKARIHQYRKPDNLR